MANVTGRSTTVTSFSSSGTPSSGGSSSSSSATIDSSNQPGWGAVKGEAPSATVYGVSEGTYRDDKGTLITREQAMKLGRIDAPDTFAKQAEKIGLYAPQSAIEERYAREDAIKRLPYTTPSQISLKERMLSSPTAAFGSQEAIQEEYNRAWLYNPKLSPEKVQAGIIPPYLIGMESRYYNAPKAEKTRTISQKERTSYPFKYYPAQKGSIAEAYNIEKEKRSAIDWYDKQSSFKKGIAIAGSMNFGIWGSYLASKIGGGGFDPSKAIQIESAEMGKEKRIYKDTTPKPSELFKQQLYSHYDVSKRPQMSIPGQIKTAAYKGLTSDVAITGASAFAFGGAIGAVGRISGLRFVPKLAGRIAVAATAVDVGLEVGTKNYPQAILKSGVFLAAAPMAKIGYVAGRNIPMQQGGLLSRAQTIKNVRKYNELISESRLTNPDIEPISSPPQTPKAYNRLVSESAFRKMGLMETIKTKMASPKGFIEKVPTIEEYNARVSESPVSFKKLSAFESLKTGIRLPKPFSQSELLYSKGKPIQEYNLMVKDPAFKRLGLKSSIGEAKSITEYNRMVSEKIPFREGLSKQTRPINVMDILLVGGGGLRHIAPAPRQVKYAPKIKSSHSNLFGRRTAVSPFISIPISVSRSQVSQSSTTASRIAHKDILGDAQRRTQKAFIGDMNILADVSIQNQRQNIDQLQNQAQEQVQKQQQILTQITRPGNIQRQRPGIEPERIKIKTPKPPKIDSTTLSTIWKKKRKSKRKGHIYEIFTPTKSISSLFKQVGKY